MALPSLSYTVDGVPLSSMAYDVEASASRRSLGAARITGDVYLPDTHGVIPGTAVHDTKDLALSMWVIGADSSGNVPTDGSQLALYEASLDKLIGLFGQRHKILTVSMTTGLSTVRQARARVVQAFAPSEDLQGAVPLAKFTVILELIDGMWQDPSVGSSTHTGRTTFLPAFLIGGTGPIADAKFTIAGPVTNPRLTNPVTGAWCQWTGNVNTGESLVIDCAAWTVKKGSTSVMSGFSYSAASGSFLELTPRLSAAGVWEVPVQVGGTQLSGGEPKLTIEARRKFL